MAASCQEAAKSERPKGIFRQAEGVTWLALCVGRRKGKGKEVALYTFVVVSICWLRKSLAPQMANGAGD